VTKFSVPGDNIIPLRLLFSNPDKADVFPTFVFKAYGGGSAGDRMGKELRGIFTLVDSFKVYASNLYHSTNTCTCYPTRPLWHTSTNYHCYIPHQNQDSGGYAILRIPLVHPTYGIIAEYDNSGNYDQFL